MNEFTEKLRSSELIWNAVNEVDKDQADVGLLIEIIRNEFKDWQPPKPQQSMPIVPEFVGEYIERCKRYDCGLIWAIRPDRDANDNSEEVYDWLFPNGVKLPNGMYPNPYEPDNLVRPDKENQIKFVRAWLDGYQVEKPQLFYLKHIDFCKTDKHYDWFTIKFSDGALNHLRVEKGEKPSTIDCKFTKQEIDSMETGSYEQIEVEP